ncbi:unnamed protein product [Aureobasidium pullulans]|nr:unnamed protein product [Aureobasidium pullulans]
MRYTTALLSLAALAAAQDCVSSYESCLTTQDENTCTSQLAVCKNLCANDLDTCNQSDAGSATCQKNYNSCLNTFPIIPGGSDCVAKYIKCGESGEADAVCNSQNAVCNACLSSGSADVAACTKQYNACYYSTSDTITLDTVAKYQNCLNTGANVTSCNAQLTNFKDACTTIQATCLVSGSADSSFCSTLTAACYYNGSKWTRQSCSTAFSACTASDSECRAQLTQCKDTCTNAEASCNTAQNADKTACASVRSTCQGDSNDPITDPNVVSSSSAAASASANAKVAASSTMSVVAAVSTGECHFHLHPVAYTGAASKAGVSAIFAGVFGVAAYLL